MSSSLQRQLQKLAAPQTAILDHKKKKESVLFSASEAANHSKETYYEIGVSGFKELAEVNEKFLKFKDSLFGLKTIDFQRTVQTKDVNASVDQNIEEFLLLLSPYLQKHASLKALEWLIQRFYIHKMNVDAMLMCLLPYYETVLFIRILQIIDIRSEQSPWKWLQQSQKGGRPIPKQTVYLRWASDEWFRNFVSKYFRKMLKVSKDDLHMRIASSLLFTTQIGGLSVASQISENHISSICQTLGKCLKSEHQEVFSGALLVVTQLVFSTQLSGEILSNVIEKLVLVKELSLVEHSLLCLLNIFFHQESSTISKTVWESLESNPGYLRHLVNMGEKKTKAAFLRPYVRASINFIVRDTSISEDKQLKKISHLAELIGSLNLVPQEADPIIRSFILGLSDCSSEFSSFQSAPKFPEILRKMELNHPEAFDCASSALLAPGGIDTLNSYQAKLINQFRNKYILSAKSMNVSNHSPQYNHILFLEDQWQKLENPGKISSSSLRFVEKIFSSLKIPLKEKSCFYFFNFNAESQYGRFLISVVKLLNLVVRLQGLGIKKDFCKLVLSQLFKEILVERKQQLYFLSSLWSCPQEVQTSIGISPALKLWSLKLASPLLTSGSSNSKPSMTWVLDENEPFFFTLISPILEGGCHSDAAFDILDQMRWMLGARLRNDTFFTFVEILVKFKEEIFADSTFLPSVLPRLISQKKSSGNKVVEKVLSFVENAKAPLHLKSSALYVLSEVHTKDILTRLLPICEMHLNLLSKLPSGESLDGATSMCLYYILLRFSSCQFFDVENGWETFHRSLTFAEPVLDVVQTLVSPQELVVNYKVLRSISNPDKLLDVLDILISRIIKTDNPTEAAKLKKELKKINLEGKQILSLVNRYQLVQKVGSVKEARAKKLKLQNEQKNSDTSLEDWKKIELIVELIGVMSDLKEPWLLIGPICDHLEALLKVDWSMADTLEQQMLSICHHLLESCSKQLNDKEFSKKCKLNVALVVRIIRASVNPDTHRRALLILSLASKYFPNQVLHNIMAIFTFMGTSLLRRDDSYSFQVIHETISSIVPTLIQSEGSDQRELLKKLSQVTQVFVDALPDLAEHRRLPLFTQLATTLGVSQYLWLVMVLIADAYVARGMAREEEAIKESPEPQKPGLPRNIKFALILYSQFSVIDQLKACFEVVDFVCCLPDDKENVDKSSESKSSCVINISTRTSRQLRQLKYTCLGLLVHLLACEKFVAQVYEMTEYAEEGDITQLKLLYRKLLERALNYLKIVLKQAKVMQGTPAGKFWLAMQRKLMDLVDSINALLPPALLLEILNDLIASDVADIKCRAMEILSSKLQPDVEFFNKKQLESLSRFISPLVSTGLSKSLPEISSQTAFFTLQLLVRRIGPLVEPEEIIPILVSSTDLVKKKDNCRLKVVTQAALVVAESIGVLKANAIAYLGDIVPAFLDILKNSSAEEEINSQLDNLIIASVTALHKIVEHLPRLLPEKSLQELFSLCCQAISKQETDGSSAPSRLTTRLTNILEHLIRNLELRVLIPSLIKTYEKMQSVYVSALPSLMKVLESLMKTVKANELIMFKQNLISLFVTALDIRNKQSDVEPRLVIQVEDSVISALIKFLLKMGEDDNIAVLLNLQNWASAQGLPSRLTSYFKFCKELAGSLKVLFIKAKLAEKIFDFAAHNLERNNNLINKDTVFGTGEEAESEATELLECVLETLSRIFMYDSVQFITEEKFSLILDPIVNQIENSIGTESEYDSRISNCVKPCIVKLTKALNDDSLWKEVNRRVLLKVRTENDAKVILAGLEVFEGLIDSLGEEFLLPVLADTIPCITEVLESLDNDVQQRTKEIYVKMESIAGDSLKAYVDS